MNPENHIESITNLRGKPNEEKFITVLGEDGQEEFRIRVLNDVYLGTENELMKHRVVYLEGCLDEEVIKRIPELQGFDRVQPWHNGYTGEETRIDFPPPTGRVRPKVVIPVVEIGN